MTDIAMMIKKAGAPVKSSGKPKEAAAEVYCSECGGAVRSDAIAGIGYIKTRRGTDIFS